MQRGSGKEEEGEEDDADPTGRQTSELAAAFAAPLVGSSTGVAGRATRAGAAERPEIGGVMSASRGSITPPREPFSGSTGDNGIAAGTTFCCCCCRSEGCGGCDELVDRT